MKIENVLISELRLDPDNANVHPEKNLEAIAASLRAFGQQKPIVVDEDGLIVAGNGTFIAAQHLAWTKLAVVRTGLPTNEARAYAIADNRTTRLAEWDDGVLGGQLQAIMDDPDLDLLSTGFNQEDVTKLAQSVFDKTEEVLLDQGIQLAPQKEYAVIMCEDADEWERLKVLLGLKPVRRGGYKEGSPFDHVGTQRVVPFVDLEGICARRDSE